MDAISTSPNDRCGDTIKMLNCYRKYVEHFDMPEARKDDMLLAVHRIMRNFVDRAFGDDSVQQSGRVEDKRHQKDELAALPVVEFQDKSLNDENQTLNELFHYHAIGGLNKQTRDRS